IVNLKSCPQLVIIILIDASLCKMRHWIVSVTSYTPSAVRQTSGLNRRNTVDFGMDISGRPICRGETARNKKTCLQIVFYISLCIEPKRITLLTMVRYYPLLVLISN